MKVNQRLKGRMVSFLVTLQPSYYKEAGIPQINTKGFISLKKKSIQTRVRSLNILLKKFIVTSTQNLRSQCSNIQIIP